MPKTIRKPASSMGKGSHTMRKPAAKNAAKKYEPKKKPARKEDPQAGKYMYEYLYI